LTGLPMGCLVCPSVAECTSLLPCAECKNCGLVITRLGNSARRSPTGWSHARWAGWEGVRCPGRVPGAVPVTADAPAAPEP
jgi:hypothetical protein